MEPGFHRLVRRKKPNGRGYGPSDFDKFDRYSACCGYGQLGEVKVTTQINFKESEWGLIGADTPGAIIHMNIGFTQPEKCKLETATILVTLGSLDEIDDKAELDALEKRPGLSSPVPSRVQFTHLGPVYVPGREMETDFSRNISVNPSLSFKDASLSGLEVGQQKTYKYYNRWVFSGQLLGDDEHSGFRKLQWFLQENKLDSPSNHRPDFEAAFALIHDHNPFFIRVEIQGKLEKRLDRVKHRFQKLKYGFYGDKPLRSTLTVVNHAGIEIPRRQLITKAKNLPEKMAKRNGVIEIVPEREKEEWDEESEGDDTDSLKVKERAKRSSLRRTPQKSSKDPFVSEVKRVHASLSTGAVNRASWLSSLTLANENGDGNKTSSEQNLKRETNDAETINFLGLIRFILQYLFLQVKYVSFNRKKPR
ncbi:hypothetical protein F4814DRAFT_430414 [Daldinia grandis]|nr:hypothetical protein F4814DRAFT_430414 [Daldinia grandis]